MDEDKKWIEEAFKAAMKNTKIDGETVGELSDRINDLFMEDFPHTMSAFTLAYGERKAIAIALELLRNTDLLSVLRCFFMSGYMTRSREEKKAQGPDENHGEKPKNCS